MSELQESPLRAPVRLAPPEHQGGYAIVLIETHTITRMGVQRMLEQAAPSSPVLAIGSPDEAGLRQLADPVTVILSSSVLPRGTAALEKLLARPLARLILLVRSLDRDGLEAMARLPVDAVLSGEDLSVLALAETLAKLDMGMVAVSRDAMRKLLCLAADQQEPAPKPPALTARELNALQLMAAGLTNRQMAKRMHITEHGVKRHVANILIKLDCQNRTMAVAIGMRLGLVEPEPHG